MREEPWTHPPTSRAARPALPRLQHRLAHAAPGPDLVRRTVTSAPTSGPTLSSWAKETDNLTPSSDGSQKLSASSSTAAETSP